MQRVLCPQAMMTLNNDCVSRGFVSFRKTWLNISARMVYYSSICYLYTLCMGFANLHGGLTLSVSASTVARKIGEVLTEAAATRTLLRAMRSHDSSSSRRLNSPPTYTLSPPPLGAERTVEHFSIGNKTRSSFVKNPSRSTMMGKDLLKRRGKSVKSLLTGSDSNYNRHLPSSTVSHNAFLGTVSPYKNLPVMSANTKAETRASMVDTLGYGPHSYNFENKLATLNRYSVAPNTWHVMSSVDSPTTTAYPHMKDSRVVGGQTMLPGQQMPSTPLSYMPVAQLQSQMPQGQSRLMPYNDQAATMVRMSTPANTMQPTVGNSGMQYFTQSENVGAASDVHGVPAASRRELFELQGKVKNLEDELNKMGYRKPIKLPPLQGVRSLLLGAGLLGLGLHPFSYLCCLLGGLRLYSSQKKREEAKNAIRAQAAQTEEYVIPGT